MACPSDSLKRGEAVSTSGAPNDIKLAAFLLIKDTKTGWISHEFLMTANKKRERLNLSLANGNYFHRPVTRSDRSVKAT